MFSRFRHVFGVLFFLLVASCSGGGCSSGCGGCGGTTPLPGGFPKDKTIDNAASVRVSRPGLDFVEKNLPAVVTKVANAPGGVLGFDIPNIDPPKIADRRPEHLRQGLRRHRTCASAGPDPAGHASPLPRGRRHRQGDVPDRRRQAERHQPQGDDPASSSTTPRSRPTSRTTRRSSTPSTSAASRSTSATATAAAATASPRSRPHALPVGITIPLVEETTAPRTGYMKIDVGNATIDLSGISEQRRPRLLELRLRLGDLQRDHRLRLREGPRHRPAQERPREPGEEPPRRPALHGAEPRAQPALPHGHVAGRREQALRLRLRQEQVRRDAPRHRRARRPRRPAQEHLARHRGRRRLRPRGRRLDDALPQRQRQRAGPHAERHHARHARRRHPAAAVEVRAAGRPQGAGRHPDPRRARADRRRRHRPTPHVGIALAGRFLDYSFGSVYNSGLLCLGVSSEQVDQLRSGLLSILIPSLKTLTFEQADAPAAIATRPQAPPTVKIGGGTNANTDALLQITLPKFALDFYLWHLDRYVRVFTFQADLLIPVNLQTGKDPKTNPNGGIIPAIGDIKVSNGSVTNADLLMDDPALVSGALSGLLGGLGKQLVGGGFSPIDLSGALKSFGLGLEIGKIGKLTKGTDDYVGIFANALEGRGHRDGRGRHAGVARRRSTSRSTTCSSRRWTARSCRSSSSTSARRSRTVATPSSTRGGSTTARAREWAAGKHVVIKDDQLLLQGRHVAHACPRASRARPRPRTQRPPRSRSRSTRSRRP